MILSLQTNERYKVSTKPLDELATLRKQIWKQEVPRNEQEKDAAIVMAGIDQDITILILEHMPIKTITLSLFYFWMTLDAPMHGVKIKKLQEIELTSIFTLVINTVKSALDKLPDYDGEHKLQEFGEMVDMLKSSLSEDYFEINLTKDEIRRTTEKINLKIHTTTSQYLKDNIHPMIVSNVLFSRWLRLSTLTKFVPESCYQKIEHYFTEVITDVRKSLPQLFQHGL